MTLQEYGGSKMPKNKERLRDNLDNVIWNIERARLSVSEHLIVNLIAVGKYTTTADIATLYSLGQRAFGENQIQQLKSRALELENLPLEWHFIGSLQKNKINNLIDLSPSLMHSLDSLSLAEELDKKLKNKNKTMKCLLQINSSYEESKSGVSPELAIDIYQKIKESCPNINLQGVMTIGAHTTETKLVQKSFEITHDIYQKLQSGGATICSMGMSSDYELAIKCGSNMIRVGSKIFN